MSGKNPCIVCGRLLTKCIAGWHYTCGSCGYEASELTPGINAKGPHQKVDEEQRSAGLKAVREENFEYVLSLLRQLGCTRGARLLDVGSGHGWFLEKAQEDYEVLGIEPDMAMHRVALSRHLNVRLGYFPDSLEADERFDVICFNDVIEHIPDISTALLTTADRLTSDGFLVLSLPDSRGFFYRISLLLARLGLSRYFLRLWQEGLPSPHVHYFNARNIRTLVERFGLKSVFSGTLSSIRREGLFQRIVYTGSRLSIAQSFEFIAILSIIPMIKMLPGDTMVQIFRKPSNWSSLSQGKQVPPSSL